MEIPEVKFRKLHSCMASGLNCQCSHWLAMTIRQSPVTEEGHKKLMYLP